MTPLRRSRWIPAMVACVTIFAWTLASNHCAFAASTRPAHACCHDQGRPAAPPSTQCCGAFNVPVPEHVSAPMGHFHEVRPAWVEATATPVPVRRVVDVAAFLAHGPPEAQSFAEIVLSRSLPAHAPPRLFV